MFETTTKELTDFIEKSPSCYHVIANFREMLTKNGYIELRENRPWKLKAAQGYFVVRADSSMIAFRIPSEDFTNYQIIAAHSDSPSFKIKENPEISQEGHYVELNVEKYGGMLCAPWFDRPLSIAGKAVVRQGNIFETRLVDFDRDLVMIPSLAVHMNRQANEGQPIKIQKDMLPIFGDETAKDCFMDMVASRLSVEKKNILGTDLFLYNRTPASIWGAHREFFSCTKLDDLQCAYAAVTALLEGPNEHSISVCCIFDNEEVGSSTKQGADSTLLSDTLERISCCLGKNQEEYKMALAASFMVSADNGHAVHPHHPDKADPTNRPYMNKGVVIKYNANQKYTTDSVSAAIFKGICEKEDIPYQVYVNHSDIAGGSTLGNISNAHISLNTIDIGLAQLAMHSPYETAGIRDTWYMIRAMKAFYSTHISCDENGNYVLL